MKRYPLKAPSAHFSDTVKLRAEMVQRFALFSEIPLEDCAKIVALAHEARFAQGKAIFFAGDPLRQVVLLTSGCVKLTQSSREGEEVNLRLVGPGETLCVECFPKYTHCQWQCQAKLQPIPTGALSLDCVRVGDFSFTIPIQWGVSMRSALTFLLLAAASLLAVPASSAQTVNPQTGAVCEPQPTNMESVRSKAETGDASAEYEMGRSMLSPRPTDSELASAVPWFRRSAEQGYAPAEYMYGGVFREGRWENPDQLVYWWTKAAEQGNVHAQLWLGVFYEQGRDDIGPNYPAAFRWLSMAAKQGQPDAQVTLGQMYENGEGVPQDYGVAAYWYRKAADHTINLGGAGLAANSLAQLYQGEHTTPQDYVFVYLGYAYVQDADGMRDVAQKMNPNQIADAQRRVSAWVKPGVPCPLTAATSQPMPVDSTSAR